MKRNHLILELVLLFVLLVIPLTVYLALTRQTVTKEAAFGEVTINLVPTETTITVSESFTVDVYLNSGEMPISAVTFTPVFQNLLQYDISPEIGSGKPFTDILPNKEGQPYTQFTLLSKKPAGQLPKGNFKIASLRFSNPTAVSGTVSFDPAKTEVVGYNGVNNEDVILTIRQGTTTAYTITGSLCKLSACPAITLSESARTDGKFNINVAWPAVSGDNVVYKVYRNRDNPVPANNPDANLAGTTTAASFLDTNNNQGVNGGEKYYYNVDAYEPCE